MTARPNHHQQQLARRVSGGVLGLLLIVCPSSCQPYLPQALDAQATANRFGKRRLDDPQLHTALVASGHWPRQAGWPPSPWRLRELQGAALHYHPELAVAKAKAATARAAITTADTRPNPAVAFAPELGSGTSPWVLGFSLDVPIETAGKRSERVVQASAQANAAALAIADTSWTVAARVRAALLEWETTARRLEILEQQATNDDEVVAMVASRVQAGEAPATDLGVYQSQQSRNRLELADGRSRLDNGRAKLADSLGVPASSIRTTPISFGPLDRFPTLPTDTALRRSALLRRSDILGALEDYAAADSALRLEIAKQTPDVHLSPGYTYDQGQSKWGLGVGLSLPLDRNRGPIREASAKRDEAAAVFERLQIGVRSELDQALAAYQTDRRRLREVDALLASQTRQLAAAERLSQSGEGDRLAVNTARALQLQATIGRLDALGQAQQSLGRLQDSAQNSLDEN